MPESLKMLFADPLRHRRILKHAVEKHEFSGCGQNHTGEKSRIENTKNNEINVMDLEKKSGLFEVKMWNTENDDKRKAKRSIAGIQSK